MLGRKRISKIETSYHNKAHKHNSYSWFRKEGEGGERRQRISRALECIDGVDGAVSQSVCYQCVTSHYFYMRIRRRWCSVTVVYCRMNLGRDDSRLSSSSPLKTTPSKRVLLSSHPHTHTMHISPHPSTQLTSIASLTHHHPHLFLPASCQ